MDSGLPQNTVYALLQSHDGFVWLGTEAGLVRFDGVQFTIFDRNSSPALPGNNDVCCMIESADGTLWVGTSEGLVQWKSGTRRVFTTADGLPGNQIRALTANGNDPPSAYTDLGLAQWAGNRYVTSNAWRSGAIPIFTRNGNIAARTPAGEGGTQGRETWKRLAELAGLPSEAIAFAAELSGDEVALATSDAVVVLEGKRVTARLHVGKELPGNRIQTLLADREGTLWIGTSDGLARWVKGKLEKLPVTDPLATSSVLTLLEDREGDLWVGTESEGLHILRDARFRTYGEREGLVSEATTAVTEDRTGALWVGTPDNGVNELLRTASGLKQVRGWNVQCGLASNVVLALAAGTGGDLWVGTPDGLNRIQGNRVSTYTSEDGLPDDFIRSLLVDADGSLWIGTRRGLTHWPGAKRSTSSPHAYLHARRWSGQRPGRRHGARCSRRSVGRNARRPFAAARRHDHELHDQGRPAKQCDHRPAAPRRWKSGNRHAGSGMGHLG